MDKCCFFSVLSYRELTQFDLQEVRVVDGWDMALGLLSHFILQHAFTFYQYSMLIEFPMQHKFVPKLGSDKINVMDHNKINQYNWGGGGGGGGGGW